MGWLFTAGALLVAVGWYGRRRRLDAVRTSVTDDVVRRIEGRGRVEVEDALDLDEAAQEEERFWSETWDEAEPW